MLQTIAARWRMASLLGWIALVLLAAAITLLPSTIDVLLIGGGFLSLALLQYPELAVYLLVFAVPFGSLMPLPIAGANVTAADGLLLLALGLWLARQIARRQITFRRASLVVPFLVFILAAGMSLTGALSLQASAKELLKWIEMLAGYWLIVQEFGPVQIERVLAAIFLAGLSEAAVGLYQYLFRVGPEGFLLFGGDALRVFGTFEQPNPYAGYLGLIIPLAFGTALGILFEHAPRPDGVYSSRQDSRVLKKARVSRYTLFILAVLSLGAMLVALFFSLSRGAWLGVAAGLAVTAIIRSKRAAAFALGLALLVAVVALLGQMNIIPDVVSARFSGVSDYIGMQDVRGVTVNDANYALVERMAHWQAAWNMFEAHPWLGVGIGNYAVVYPLYALPHWDDPLGHAHNYYLNVAAESGIIGLAGYLFLWGAIFWTAWGAVRTTRGFAQGVAAGAFGVLVALSIHNLFDNLFVHSMQIQVAITLGLVQLARHRE